MGKMEKEARNERRLKAFQQAMLTAVVLGGVMVVAATIPNAARLLKYFPGELEVIGVVVIPTPGHSPGHQSVVVETKSGKVIAAGDAVMSGENLLGDAANHLRFNMLGRYVNMKDAWNSLEKLANIGGTILPGHDCGVFNQPLYR